MNSPTTYFAAPDGFPSLPEYSAEWRAVRFELSPGTGEWVTSHIAFVDPAGFLVTPVLRPAVLRAIFGTSAKGFESLLSLTQKSLERFLESDGQLEDWNPPVEGFAVSQVKRVFARRGRIEALRMAARQSTVMCVLDDLNEPIESEPSEEDSRWWSSRIKDAVLERRPELSSYFDRTGKLYSDTARFGFLTDSAGAHFANLVPHNATQSMRMARGKLQELRVGAKTMHLAVAKLITGAPRADDITLTDRQVAANQRAINELRLEADESGVALDVVHSPDEAAESIIALV